MNTVPTCVVCPKQAKTEDGSLVCFGCSNKILGWLRELEDTIPTLSLEKQRKGSERGAPGFASQSPANDTAIHHTDWRSSWDALDGLGAVAVIHQWARAVREEREYQPPKYITLVSEIGALRTNHQWLMFQPFVDEYARELKEVHAAVRATSGDPIPKAAGRCIAVHAHGDCQGQVYELDDASGVRCSTCRRVYSGLDLARFNAAQREGAG